MYMHVYMYKCSITHYICRGNFLPLVDASVWPQMCALTLSLSVSLSLSLSRSLTHSFSLPPSFPHPLSLFLSLSLPPSLSLPLSLPPPLSRSRTHKHTHTFCVQIPLCRGQTLKYKYLVRGGATDSWRWEPGADRTYITPTDSAYSSSGVEARVEDRLVEILKIQPYSDVMCERYKHDGVGFLAGGYVCIQKHLPGTVQYGQCQERGQKGGDPTCPRQAEILEKSASY
jgi:hypothetical protein